MLRLPATSRSGDGRGKSAAAEATEHRPANRLGADGDLSPLSAPFRPPSTGIKTFNHPNSKNKRNLFVEVNEAQSNQPARVQSTELAPVSEIITNKDETISAWIIIFTAGASSQKPLRQLEQ